MQNREFPCSQCGHLNPIGIYYCINCGKKFSYTCPECSSNVTPDAKYCLNCGAELLWNTSYIQAKPPEKLPQKNDIEKADVKIESPLKKENKKIMSPVPWIIIFIVIIIVIALLFNIDKIFS